MVIRPRVPCHAPWGLLKPPRSQRFHPTHIPADAAPAVPTSLTHEPRATQPNGLLCIADLRPIVGSMRAPARAGARAALPQCCPGVQRCGVTALVCGQRATI